MVRADAASGIAVEILMEEHEVLPVGIGLEWRECSGDGPAPGCVAQKNPVEASGDFSRDLRQGHLLPAAGRKFHAEILTEVAIKLLQRFDEKEVQRKPDGAAPVGVPAEKVRLRFGRLVVHT